MNSSKSAVGKLDPRALSFDSVIAKTRAPRPVKASVFLAADNAARIVEIDAELDRLAAEEYRNPQERSIVDEDPAKALLAERDALVEELNDSEVELEFRVLKRGDYTAARAAMIADGHDLDADGSMDLFACYTMAETCISTEWTGGQWLQFRDAIGEPAFRHLADVTEQAATANVTAPFSRRPSPTRTTPAQ